jgi:hypothetical protein
VVGVSSVTRVFVQQKVRSIAILKPVVMIAGDLGRLSPAPSATHRVVSICSR